jgi:pyridoxine 5-phosphate synthase
MTTTLSLNLNKIALIRNARGGNYPDLLRFAETCLQLGADGITLHPRPDERHARFADLPGMAALCARFGKELNVEGQPSDRFMQAMAEVRPAQVTLVPDAPGQLTSDHGWDVAAHAPFLRDVIARLNALGCRVSLFIDPGDAQNAREAAAVGAQRIELYTGPYAAAFAKGEVGEWLERYRETAQAALSCGLEVNAGHDLNLQNLSSLLQAFTVSEVSIGHAFVVECIERGLEEVLIRYLKIVRS